MVREMDEALTKISFQIKNEILNQIQSRKRDGLDIRLSTEEVVAASETMRTEV